MLGDGERMVMVVVAVHVGDLQLGFEDGGFYGHNFTFSVVVGAVLMCAKNNLFGCAREVMSVVWSRHG